MIKDIASKCVEDLQKKIEAINANANGLLWVYSEANFLNASKGINFPAVGVIYEGMRGNSENEKTTNKIGGSGSLVVSLILAHNNGNFAGGSEIFNATAILDEMRSAIIDTKSPTGHKWRFVVEAPSEEKNGGVIWLQRWDTPVMIV